MRPVSAWVASQPGVPALAFSSVIGFAAASGGSANATPSPSVSWRKKRRKLPTLALLLLLFLALPLDLLEALLALLGQCGGRLNLLLGRGGGGGIVRADDGHEHG